MLDTPIFDRLLEDGVTVKRLRGRSDMKLVVTHIQHDQVERTPDIQKRMRLLKLLNELTISIDTDGEICGISRCGAARLGDPHEYGEFMREKTSPAQHQEDALIALTSKADCDFLVTDDATLLSTAKRKGVEALCYDDFKRELCSE